MGTPGVPFNVPKDIIIKAIKKHHGKLTYVAKDLDCDFTTIKRYLEKHPDLKELVDACRHNLDELLLDSAEDVLMTTMMNAKKDATNALKSAFFALNNKGKPRGYGNILTNSFPDEMIEKFDAHMAQLAKVQSSALKQEDTSSINESKS